MEYNFFIWARVSKYILELFRVQMSALTLNNVNSIFIGASTKCMLFNPWSVILFSTPAYLVDHDHLLSIVQLIAQSITEKIRLLNELAVCGINFTQRSSILRQYGSRALLYRLKRDRWRIGHLRTFPRHSQLGERKPFQVFRSTRELCT